MTGVAVAAGPAMVLGPHPVDPELGAAAVEFIDDELALVAGKPRSVTGLWRQVLHAAAGADPPAVRLICPRWWSRDRVQRVFDAARTVAELVEVHRRAELLAERAGTTGAVVEIAPEHVAVCAAGTVELVARSDDVDGVCSVVCATVTTLPVRPAAVLVDAPAEVPGAAVLAGILVDRLRRRRIAVTVAEPDWWRQPPAEPERKTRAPGKTDRFGARRRRRPAAGGVVAGAVLAALTLTLMGVWPSSAGPERTETTMPDSMPTTLLVEGRIGVVVPVSWPPQRVTGGPGSARLQLVSPENPRRALHITQSVVPAGHTHRQMADALAAALRDQRDGVFTAFDPADQRGDRAVVSYREVRAGHHIEWVVLLDREVRIAIGCQYPLPRDSGTDAVSDPICEQAVRSAHAVV